MLFDHVLFLMNFCFVVNRISYKGWMDTFYQRMFCYCNLLSAFSIWIVQRLMTIEPQPLHSTPHPLWPRQILYLSSIIQGILADPLQSTVWCSFCLHTNILLWRPIFIADDFIWNSTTYYRYLFFILITC